MNSDSVTTRNEIKTSTFAVVDRHAGLVTGFDARAKAVPRRYSIREPGNFSSMFLFSPRIWSSLCHLTAVIVNQQLFWETLNIKDGI